MMQLSVLRNLQFVVRNNTGVAASALRVQTYRFSTEPPVLPPCNYSPPPYQGPPVSEILKIRKAHLNPALFSYYSTPLVTHAGYMQYLFDHENKRYLDFFGGIVTISVGHCHPAVVEASEKQLRTLWHTSNIYLHPNIHEYSKALADTLPGNLNGSEANDLALLMARLHTERFDIITLRNSYHGASPYTMGLAGCGKTKFPFANGFGIHHVMNPDPYRGLWGGHRDSPVQSVRANESTVLEDGTCSSSLKYIGQLQELIDCCIPQGKPAGFFAEPIQGVGATVQYPLGYLKRAFDLIKDRGGVCIADEIQTGFGRTGDHFWGFQGHGVIPDIVTMAKGIGNGYPLAAVVTTPEIAQSMNKGFHFNTFGGNALGSGIGLAVLKTIKETKVQENSKEVGTWLIEQLGLLRDEFKTVGDVRGKGLMIGVELVENQVSHNPMNMDRVNGIWENCREMGLLIGKGGNFNNNVFRVKPPMCITKADAQFALSVLRSALKKDLEENQ